MLITKKFYWLEKYYRWKDKLEMKIAWLLPDSIVEWCAIRVISKATTGEYANEDISTLPAMEALKRFAA